MRLRASTLFRIFSECLPTIEDLILCRFRCFSAIRIAMAPMQAVEVARFMGGMDRHAREARLLEIDHTRARNLID